MGTGGLKASTMAIMNPIIAAPIIHPNMDGIVAAYCHVRAAAINVHQETHLIKCPFFSHCFGIIYRQTFTEKLLT